MHRTLPTLLHHLLILLHRILIHSVLLKGLVVCVVGGGLRGGGGLPLFLVLVVIASGGLLACVVLLALLQGGGVGVGASWGPGSTTLINHIIGRARVLWRLLLCLKCGKNAARGVGTGGLNCGGAETHCSVVRAAA